MMTRLPIAHPAKRVCPRATGIEIAVFDFADQHADNQALRNLRKLLRVGIVGSPLLHEHTECCKWNANNKTISGLPALFYVLAEPLARANTVCSSGNVTENQLVKQK